MKLLSDQISQTEIKVILRELANTLAVEGDIVEFGCYVGTTSVYLGQHSASHKKLYLYDSFAGLPPKTAEDSSPAGMQFKAGELLATKKQLITNLKRAGVDKAIIKKAWFSDLTDVDVPEQISFAFLDGDYYHSVMDPLKLIWDKLTPGAIVVVDDYANEALPGAAKAVDEWLSRHPARLRVEASLAIINCP